MTDKLRELNVEPLYEKLNLETGRLGWSELQPHFARGVVISLDPTLDLIDVAMKFVQDDKNSIAAWLGQGLVRRATAMDARHWDASQPQFWAVVVAPWVLVQEISPQ